MKFFAVHVFLFVSVAQLCAQDIPFKPKDDFEVTIDLKFKPRPSDDPNTVQFGDNAPRKSSSALLPYLNLRVTLLKVSPGEVRYKVENNLQKKGVSKKIQKLPVLDIDAGFTDDIKARLRPSEYLITMLDDNKASLSKILIQIEKDGTFLVNGEKRGKF